MELDAAKYRRVRNPEEEAPLDHARAVAPPERQPVQHGLYLEGSTFFPCNRCAVQDRCPGYERGGTCALEREYAATRGKQIREALVEAGHDADLHEALVMSAVLAELRLARVTRFLSVTPELREGVDGLDYQPAAKMIPALQREVRDGLAALNLTPAAIARLEADRRKPDSAMAATILGMGMPGQLANGGAVDAEFEDEQEGDGGAEGAGGG